MNARELYARLLTAVCDVYDEREAQAVAEFIMEHKFGVARMARAMDPSLEVDAEDVEQVLRDAKAGRPAQYIAGGTWFCDVWLEVCESVLIPRPETGELVAWMLEDGLDGRVLDVGTGSGAIAIALARAGGQVTAIDISDDALAVARRNARRIGVDIDFARCDILHDRPVGQLDIVVSNPPYVPQSDRAAMHYNVTEHEPAGALFVPDDDPLVFYRAIAALGAGRVYLEIYEHFAEGVCDVLHEAGYADVEVRRDINGRERMVRARSKKTDC